MGALDGIRIIDLSRILAGPFCTQVLADLGADVIKIETPAGDPVREQGARVDGFSWYFAQFNRNKKSVVLDLYKEEDRRALARLLEGADVVVENFRPGVFAKMGFDAGRLEAINPRLIVASVNGYGSTGPYVDRPSFDFIAQAMSGYMACNGDPQGPPMRSAAPISDLIAGLYAALGVVSALEARHRTGTGQRVESSLMNGLISMHAYLSAQCLATGENPVRTGNDHPIVAPYGLFEAADGQIAVAPSNDTYVERFLGVLELASLLEQPAFCDNRARMRNRADLNERINAVTRTRSVAHWIERINAAGCPCGRVMALDEVLSDPQVLAQEMVIESTRDDDTAHVKMTGFPIKFSQTPCALRLPPPRLGEHTEEVLAGITGEQAGASHPGTTSKEHSR